MLGKQLILFLHGLPVAASKTCTLEMDTSLLPVASPGDGLNDDFVADRQGWTVQTDCLLADISAAYDIYLYYLSRNPVFILIRDEADTVRFTGMAFIERWQVTGTVKQLATVSISLRGSEALTMTRRLLLHRDPGYNPAVYTAADPVLYYSDDLPAIPDGTMRLLESFDYTSPSEHNDNGEWTVFMADIVTLVDLDGPQIERAEVELCDPNLDPANGIDYPAEIDGWIAYYYNGNNTLNILQ